MVLWPGLPCSSHSALCVCVCPSPAPALCPQKDAAAAGDRGGIPAAVPAEGEGAGGPALPVRHGGGRHVGQRGGAAPGPQRQDQRGTAQDRLGGRGPAVRGPQSLSAAPRVSGPQRAVLGGEGAPSSWSRATSHQGAPGQTQLRGTDTLRWGRDGFMAPGADLAPRHQQGGRVPRRTRHQAGGQRPHGSRNRR